MPLNCALPLSFAALTVLAACTNGEGINIAQAPSGGSSQSGQTVDQVNAGEQDSLPPGILYASGNVLLPLGAQPGVLGAPIGQTTATLAGTPLLGTALTGAPLTGAADAVTAATDQLGSINPAISSTTSASLDGATGVVGATVSAGGVTGAVSIGGTTAGVSLGGATTTVSTGIVAGQPIGAGNTLGGVSPVIGGVTSGVSSAVTGGNALVTSLRTGRNGATPPIPTPTPTPVPSLPLPIP